ncbi:MAG: hypothetical protein EPGJADBJ_01837 [Saprospiraceae bacterium]|nr:hypothetical protein [Saprospiraceae bacterium]
MPESYFPTSEHFDAALAIALVTVGFILFWSVVTSRSLTPRLAGVVGYERAQETKIYLQRLVGICFYGVFPALVFLIFLDHNWSDFGVLPRWTSQDLLWILGLSVLALPLSYAGARKVDSQEMYPEIRRPEWRSKTLILSALAWAVYISAYELMFRGFLLFSCDRAFGAGAAIAVNTSIYALTHVPKRMTEGIGAIVFGVILSLITLRTGTIWVSVLVHIVLALSNEWFSLRFNPHIRYAP